MNLKRFEVAGAYVTVTIDEDELGKVREEFKNMSAIVMRDCIKQSVEIIGEEKKDAPYFQQIVTIMACTLFDKRMLTIEEAMNFALDEKLKVLIKLSNKHLTHSASDPRINEPSDFSGTNISLPDNKGLQGAGKIENPIQPKEKTVDDELM